MFVKDGNVYRKVYARKDGSKFFIRDSKRVTVTKSRKMFMSKPKPKCQMSRERIPSGYCAKKCKPTQQRRRTTSRCYMK